MILGFNEMIKMNKIFNNSNIASFAWMLLILVSCTDDFLDRPPENSYVASGFYSTDAEVQFAANALYGGIWFEYPLIQIGDRLGGNYDKRADPFWTYDVNSLSPGIQEAYNSLWTVASHASLTIENLENYASENVSNEALNSALGEAYVWKAMAYFYLVRCFGDVPIVHDLGALVQQGPDASRSLSKNRKEDVYEYIVRMLTHAGAILPAENDPGRINKWSAYGLLAKVYLTRSGLGQDGSRLQSDLDNAVVYADSVVNHSGLALHPEFKELFWISKGNLNPENLISIHWTIDPDWGSQNVLQANMAPEGMTTHGDGWGAWTGVSLDLQDKFGEDARTKGEDRLDNPDSRRKATIMMDRDTYPEIWQAEGGFTIYWGQKPPDLINGASIQNYAGSLPRKHLVGSAKDHEREAGRPSEFMKTDLSTHLLRLSDVYLILAEAIIGNAGSTTDAKALAAYNAVRRRAGADEVSELYLINNISRSDDYENVTAYNQRSAQSIYDERRRELAFEGDNWFDFVRMSYYDPTGTINLIQGQNRLFYTGNPYAEMSLNDAYSSSLTGEDFTLPIPPKETDRNPNLLPEAESAQFDFSSIEFYAR